jgi:hypothetical protein
VRRVNQNMLDYCLNHVQVGVRMMFRDKSSVHAFDYDRDGEFMFLMAVTAEKMLGNFEASKPLETGHE